MADIVLPATTGLERDDIGYSRREPFLIAMKKAREPIGEARDDYWIFSEITRRLGADDVYTEGRDAMQWLAHMHEESRQKSAKMGVDLPSFEDFWEAGIAKVPGENRDPVMLAKFRADPAANPLKTPSGKIEIFSEKIASFGYDDCPGHAVWLEPIEWLGSETAERYPLHMLSDQPADKLHSQLDHSPARQGDQGEGPPARHDASGRRRRARHRRRRPVARLQRPRRLPRRGPAVGPHPPRRGAALDRRLVRPAGLRLQHARWRSTAIPNALTLDIGASKLSQGCIAQTCLVEIERFDGPAPLVTAHQLPAFSGR